MPKVFQTQEAAHESVELVGVGLLHPSGEGPGISIEEAAHKMSELQDDEGKPLSGKKLEESARNFAEARDLRVVEMSDAKRESARSALTTPDRPPAAEVAEADYRSTYAVEPVHDNPEDVVAGGPDVGQPAPPPSIDDKGGDA